MADPPYSPEQEPLPVASFFSMTLSPARVAWFAVYALLLCMLFPVAAAHLDRPAYFPSLCLAFALGLIVPGVLVFKRRVDLIEPINWFSFMYWFVFPGAVYFLIVGFGASEHILTMTEPRLERAATLAMTLFLIGYLSFLAGYAMLARDVRPREVRLPSMREFSPFVGRAVIAAGVLIGLANFVYLLLNYPGGMLGYLLDFGLRARRYEMIGTEVTTVGYQFIYAAVYLWLMVLLRQNRIAIRYTEVWLFFVAVVLSIVISVSQGRMGQSITYVFGLGLLLYATSAGHARNLRYVALIAVGMAFGVVLYMLRRASAAAFSGAEDFAEKGIAAYASQFLGDIAWWIVGKGNVPNVPVVMNLIETDGLDGQLLYGSSFVTWLPGLIAALDESRNIGQTLGKLWLGAEGGLPPTIVGEMLVNFGPLGVPVGMFLAGSVCACFYHYVRRKGEYLWYVVYVAVLLRFLFIWPKGEAANLTGAIWGFLPTVAMYGLVRLMSWERTIPRAPRHE